MALSLVLLGVVAVTLQAPVWTPPENPDPSKILQEAHANTRAGQHELALAKHVWYHDHALGIEPGHGGVRLSFALGYWHELGKKYPPALQKMVSYRDVARERVLAGKDVFAAFHDLTAFNRTLKNEPLTREVFLQLDEKSPETARQVYRLAEPSLIRAKDYQLCGKYLHPEKEWELIVSGYEAGRRFEAQNQRPVGAPLFAEQHLRKSTTTLIALLVQNQREDEAKSIAEKARKLLDSQEFHSAIDEALKGVVPEPRP